MNNQNSNPSIKNQLTEPSPQITDYMIDHMEKLIVRGYFNNKSDLLRKAVQKIVYDNHKNKMTSSRYHKTPINN